MHNRVAQQALSNNLSQALQLNGKLPVPWDQGLSLSAMDGRFRRNQFQSVLSLLNLSYALHYHIKVTLEYAIS
jgi:hypothetical protein